MQNSIYNERLTCRLCGNSLEIVLDLGDIYLNDFVNEGDEIVSAPLTLARCLRCQLVQLKHTANLDRLYRQYWYQSALNKSMVVALQDIVDNIEKRIVLYPGDVVIDIGCNDGTLLGQYKNPNLTRIGFDPALNLADKAKKHCNIFYNTYFGDVSVAIPPAKVITSIAMFYDLEDPHTFVELIKHSLHKDGIWIIQFTDLMSMFKANAFDNICHEHLEYYSFEVLRKLLEQHEFTVFDVSTNSVNGGSIRIYTCHKDNRNVESTVDKLFKEEQIYMAQFEDPFKSFAKRVENIRQSITKLIRDEKQAGKKICVMGASTKGNTLLQYFKLDFNEIDYAAEVNSDKFGKRTVCTNIPIISEKEAIEYNPDYFLVLPWHFKNNLIEKHRGYLNNGGKFIFPCPEFEVVQ